MRRQYHYSVSQAFLISAVIVLTFAIAARLLSTAVQQGELSMASLPSSGTEILALLSHVR